MARHPADGYLRFPRPYRPKDARAAQRRTSTSPDFPHKFQLHRRTSALAQATQQRRSYIRSSSGWIGQFISSFFFHRLLFSQFTFSSQFFFLTSGGYSVQEGRRRQLSNLSASRPTNLDPRTRGCTPRIAYRRHETSYDRHTGCSEYDVAPSIILSSPIPSLFVIFLPLLSAQNKTANNRNVTASADCEARVFVWI